MDWVSVLLVPAAALGFVRKVPALGDVALKSLWYASPVRMLIYNA